MRTTETTPAPLAPSFLPNRPVTRLLIPGRRMLTRYIYSTSEIDPLSL